MRKWFGGEPLYIKWCEEIVRLYGYNLSYREIEKCLGISCSTVTKALRYAERNGLYGGICNSEDMALSNFCAEVRQYLVKYWNGDNRSKYRRRPIMWLESDHSEDRRSTDYELTNAAFVACLRAYHPERETGIKKK